MSVKPQGPRRKAAARAKASAKVKAKAKAIATSLGLPAEGLETYRLWGMYLDDLSCCGEERVC